MKNSCVKNRTLESMVIIFMECFTLKKVKRWKKPIIRIMPKNNNNSGGKKLAHKYEPAKVILKWNKQRMNVKNITYVESYAHYLLIHTLNSTVKVREKISVALQKLEPLGFIQVHRSYVINHDRIKKIDTDNITLSDETIIPIGKKYKQALKNH